MTGDLPLLGFGLPVSGSWATLNTMRRTARRAEELGYATLWTFQRVLHPADGELDPAHRAVHDPVVALAHVAGQPPRSVRMSASWRLRMSETVGGPARCSGRGLRGRVGDLLFSVSP